MSKLAVAECPHCGGEHKLTLKEIDPPIGLLKARVTAVATCPDKRLPILEWSYDASNEVVWPEDKDG